MTSPTQVDLSSYIPPCSDEWIVTASIFGGKEKSERKRKKRARKKPLTSFFLKGCVPNHIWRIYHCFSSLGSCFLYTFVVFLSGLIFYDREQVRLLCVVVMDEKSELTFHDRELSVHS